MMCIACTLRTCFTAGRVLGWAVDGFCGMALQQAIANRQRSKLDIELDDLAEVS